MSETRKSRRCLRTWGQSKGKGEVYYLFGEMATCTGSGKDVKGKNMENKRIKIKLTL